jgi:hypothetical protein
MAPRRPRELPLTHAYGLAYDKALCASIDGFSLHAATRAGGINAAARGGALALRPAASDRAGAELSHALIVKLRFGKLTRGNIGAAGRRLAVAPGKA